ncbi:MAG: ROK family transcriptional regulator [Anaerolineae bacterium]
MTGKLELRGNRDLMKAMNRSLLLNIIRREGELSRTQLAEQSGLSVGAVSQIIAALMDEGWILESGEGEFTGGRRQVLLRLNPTAAYAVGVKLMERRIVCAVTDFEAHVVHYHDQRIRFESNPRAESQLIASVVETTIAESGVPRERLLGVGVGIAGVIYSDTGVVHYSPYFGWRDVPLAGLLAEQVNLPVYVENDVNTLTFTEMLFGDGRYHSNVVVVTIGRGIGMGIVINGQLYQGSQGGAGELGHTILDAAASRGVADQGSLETMASDPMVLKSLSKNGTSPTIEEVVAAADAGDADARAALAHSGELLGVGLANVINILCPNLLIVSGEGLVAGAHRLEPMFDAIRRCTFNGLLDDVQILIKPTDDHAWARGAASLVISKTFESPLVAGHYAPSGVAADGGDGR